MGVGAGAPKRLFSPFVFPHSLCLCRSHLYALSTWPSCHFWHNWLLHSTLQTPSYFWHFWHCSVLVSFIPLWLNSGHLCQWCCLHSCGLKLPCPPGVSAWSYSLCPLHSSYFWDCILSLHLTSLCFLMTTRCTNLATFLNFLKSFTEVLYFWCASIADKQLTATIKRKWFWLQQKRFSTLTQFRSPQSCKGLTSNLPTQFTPKVPVLTLLSLSNSNLLHYHICYLEFHRISTKCHYLSEDMSPKSCCVCCFF